MVESLGHSAMRLVKGLVGRLFMPVATAGSSMGGPQTCWTLQFLKSGYDAVVYHPGHVSEAEEDWTKGEIKEIAQNRVWISLDGLNFWASRPPSEEGMVVIWYEAEQHAFVVRGERKQGIVVPALGADEMIPLWEIDTIKFEHALYYFEEVHMGGRRDLLELGTAVLEEASAIQDFIVARRFFERALDELEPTDPKYRRARRLRLQASLGEKNVDSYANLKGQLADGIGALEDGEVGTAIERLTGVKEIVRQAEEIELLLSEAELFYHLGKIEAAVDKRECERAGTHLEEAQKLLRFVQKGLYAADFEKEETRIKVERLIMQGLQVWETDLNKAVECFQKAVELEPTNPTVTRAQGILDDATKARDEMRRKGGRIAQEAIGRLEKALVLAEKCDPLTIIEDGKEVEPLHKETVEYLLEAYRNRTIGPEPPPPPPPPELPPFDFYRIGKKASTVAELVQICDLHWTEGIFHLYNGKFEKWLDLPGNDPQLAKMAANIRDRYSDQSEGLERFLRATGLVEPPSTKDLDTNLTELLPDLCPPAGRRATLRITNQGRGRFLGRVAVSRLAWWLSVPQPDFGCLSGQTVEVDITCDPRKYKRWLDFAVRPIVIKPRNSAPGLIRRVIRWARGLLL